MNQVSHPPALTGTKTCTACARTLPVLAFAADHHHADGLQSRCRACKTAYNRKRYAEEGTRRAMRRADAVSGAGREPQ